MFAGPGYKFSMAMLIGAIGGFLLGRHVYDVLAIKTNSVCALTSGSDQ